jgi:hypothetical protein
MQGELAGGVQDGDLPLPLLLRPPGPQETGPFHVHRPTLAPPAGAIEIRRQRSLVKETVLP